MPESQCMNLNRFTQNILVCSYPVHTNKVQWTQTKLLFHEHYEQKIA